MRLHLLHRVPNPKADWHNRLGLVLDLAPIVAARGDRLRVFLNRIHCIYDMR